MASTVPGTSEAVQPQAAPLKKTALNATHRALKAKMVDFGGWDMPVEYPCPGGGLIAEHLAVRTGVGLFDVSHMGEIQFRGPGSLAAVQHITMNDASKLADGQAHYSALLTHQGTFVDDILVHRLSPNDYLLVVNAGTKDKDLAWIRQQVGSWSGIHISDYSSYYSQLALQGPRALETLAKLTKVDLAAIRNYWFTWGTVAGIPNVLIARTGYSGEDGFEVYIPSDEATTVKMWEALLDAGAEFGIRPCGLGARNTLRLEAGMSLYGHEISEEINVLEAGLNRWLKLDKGEFIGRDALLEVQAAGGPKRKVVGLEMVERGIGRDGYPVFSVEGEQIGTITSGSPAPFLKTNIAMALVPAAVAESGADVMVQCRANPVRAKQVPLPFYKRAKKQ
ncbi:MAG TPA: glycine cleavage system aminomethyltransferase GcvT [Terracidiphilus sp.]|nr:glycine cleavage system aminomethyltransferase GcvT [Terracidiphilus sp.]